VILARALVKKELHTIDTWFMSLYSTSPIILSATVQSWWVNTKYLPKDLSCIERFSSKYLVSKICLSWTFWIRLECIPSFRTVRWSEVLLHPLDSVPAIIGYPSAFLSFSQQLVHVHTPKSWQALCSSKVSEQMAWHDGSVWSGVIKSLTSGKLTKLHCISTLPVNTSMTAYFKCY